MINNIAFPTHIYLLVLFPVKMSQQQLTMYCLVQQLHTPSNKTSMTHGQYQKAITELYSTSNII